MRAPVQPNRRGPVPPDAHSQEQQPNWRFVVITSLKQRLSLGLGASVLALGLVAGLAGPAPASPEKTVMVGGAPMYPSKNIVQNAVNSKDHTTLVAAVKAAGLVETLSGPGPFTVFAPTNAAFAKLPAGTVDTLLKPENKGKLTGILTYHVVPTRALSGAIAKMIKDDGGMHEIKTVAGGRLWASMKNGQIVLKDEQGRMAKVTIANVVQSNGVIHVIDTVLLPN
jgi:uncharacterized surface protein with fasciclin (FAS1) repeats